MNRCQEIKHKMFIEEFLQVPIEEMANIIPKYSGITGYTIHIMTKEEMSNPQGHALGRLKLQQGKSINIGTCSIQLNKKGQFETSGFRSKGDQRLLIKLKKFIHRNRKVLWAYWLTPMIDADFGDLTRNLKPIK